MEECLALFYWNLLTGVCSRTHRHFHQAYSGDELWKHIPVLVRPYWVEAIKGEYCTYIQDHYIPDKAYASCVVQSATYFEDRTEDMALFQSDETGFLRFSLHNEYWSFTK